MIEANQFEEPKHTGAITCFHLCLLSVL